mgnify:CR=1 FL=1
MKTQTMTRTAILSRALPATLMVAAALAFAAAAAAAQISIVSPKPKETVHNNQGEVTVHVAADLAPGQQVRLLVDGESVAQGRGSSFNLSGIHRGTHQLTAQVIDAGGTVLAESQPVEFYMWQASRLFPSRSN